MSCRELIRILHLSSLAILDCLINEIAVTKVSIALANSPALASCTALDIALLETVLFLWKISSNSCSLSAGDTASDLSGGGLE